MATGVDGNTEERQEGRGEAGSGLWKSVTQRGKRKMAKERKIQYGLVNRTQQKKVSLARDD